MATKAKAITTEQNTNNLNNEVLKYQVTAETSIHDALLLASTMERKKSEIYTSVAEAIRKLHPWKIERKEGVTSFNWPKGFALTTYLSGQFPEFPRVKIIDKETGKPTKQTEVMPLTAAMKEVGNFDTKTANAVHAVNRFSVWFSGYKLQLIRQFNEALAEAEKAKIAAQPMDDDSRKANESHIDKMFGLSREPGQRTQGRLLDMSGNVKEDNVKSLPPEHRQKLIQSLATEAPEETAKILSVVTGKKVQIAEKIEDLRARQLLDRLEQVASSEFSAPSTALKLIQQLKGMLLEEKATATNGKPAGKAKGKVKTATAA